jgi:hypothetical protein
MAWESWEDSDGNIQWDYIPDDVYTETPYADVPTILEPEEEDPFVFSGKPGESNMANAAAGLRSAPAGTGEGYSGWSVADSNAANAAGFDIGKAVSGLGSSLVKTAVDRYTKDGVVNWGAVAKDAAALYMAKQAYDQASKPVLPTGYQGKIPEYTGLREQLTPVTGARPGAGGQRYFTDLKYATGAGLPAAQTLVATQATALNKQNAELPKAPAAPVNPDPASNTFFGRTPAQAMQALTGLAAAPRNTAPVTQQATIPANQRPIFKNNDEIMAFNDKYASGPLSENWVMPDDTYYGPTPTPPNFEYVMPLPSVAVGDKDFFSPSPAQAVRNAEGGLMGYARGGVPTKPEGTYLRGETDGMADQIHATIDGKQPARLAHGEFVVPADVVSHLGNGNSDAGAKQLYKMMDRIRMARTGNKKQGKQINPNKFAPGGIAGYANGGSIQHFATGDAVPAGTTGTESNLSNYIGPYVTNMLGKGQALSEQPYQAYQGPLTAGPSALQTTGFQNAANLTTPMGIGQAADTAGSIAGKMQGLNYQPSQFSNQFNTPSVYQTGQMGTQSFTGQGTADQYMNPYMQSVVDIQKQEAQRQSDIQGTQQQAQAAQAGAFGGSRDAIMRSERERNLGTQMGSIQAQGSQAAFQQAQQQFNTEQQAKMAAQQAQEQSRQFGAQQGLTAAQAAAQYGTAAQQAQEQSRQFGSNFGLQGLQGALSAAQTQGNLGATQNAAGLANLNAQLTAGGQQQGIEQAGITADQAAFNAERDNPYKMVQYQQSLLQGLPLAAQSYNITNNPYAAAAKAFTGTNDILKNKD